MIAQYTVFETAFHSAATYDNPLWDVTLKVRFSGPGEAQTVEAFWDGGATWRVRFSPTAVGLWSFETFCSDESDSGLHGQTGTFECVPYEGENPLYQHGPLQLSANRRYLQHADGTPFFWLGDTAWNGVLLAKTPDWARYLKTRKAQGFNVIQFVATQWRASTKGDAAGELAFEGTDRITLNPAFFQRADPKVAMMNAYGMIAAPVMLWTLTEIDPGQTLSEAAATRVAQYQQARWGAYQVVWLLGGDGRYHQDDRAARFKRIGRATFGQRHNRLVTMHPCGISWVGEEFRSEPWYDFIGYQSGHGDSDEHVRWLVQGPPATEWSNEPVLPVINLEPNYEGHPAYQSGSRFSPHQVRRASYWSVLVSPPAGVTYGNNEIWAWREDPGPAENHPNIGTVQPWHAGLETPGIEGMTLLRRFFEQVRWTELEPAPGLLRLQPGDDNPNHFIAAVRTPDGAQMVIYLPVGGKPALAQAYNRARWYNPRTGDWSEAAPDTAAPDDQDWLLLLEA
jgi:hypothetical protein